MNECPILALFELLGQKWILSILYVIKVNPGIGFNELKLEVNLTPKTLSSKLVYLEEHNLITKQDDGFKNHYHLTPAATELAKNFEKIDPIARQIIGKKKC